MSRIKTPAASLPLLDTAAEIEFCVVRPLS